MMIKGSGTMSNLWTIKQVDEYGNEAYLWYMNIIENIDKPVKFYSGPDCPVYKFETRELAREVLKMIKQLHPCACEKGRFKLSVVKYLNPEQSEGL